jgi:hypothetical protein
VHDIELRKRPISSAISAAILIAACSFCFASICYSQGEADSSPLTTKTETESPDSGAAKINNLDATAASTNKAKSPFRWLKNTPFFFKLKYFFVAQNADECEFFYGLVQDNPLIGRASVDFQSANGCNCHGVAQVTHFPHGGGTVGQKGSIKVKCSDGRIMRGTFTTTSLTTGNASFSDNLGHKYESTFGHTAAQAIETINTLRKQLGCPEVTAQEVEMKVQGRILEK